MSSGRPPMPAVSSHCDRPTASTLGSWLKLKMAMNWLIISSMNTRPARPAKVLVTAAMTSLELVNVPAPKP